MSRPKSEVREWRYAWSTLHELDWLERLWKRWFEKLGRKAAREKMRELLDAAYGRVWPEGVDGPAVLSLMRSLVA